MEKCKRGFTHWVFTRYNLLDDKTSIYNNPAIPDPVDWMRHRTELFEKYTLPSMKAQTCKNFTWLLSFAKQTPYYLIPVKHWDYSNIKIIYEYPRTFLRNCYLFGKFNKGDWIITTRLDNDDFLEPNYIREVQNYLKEPPNFPCLIVDTDGVQWDIQTDKFYTTDRRTNNSPFLSFIEKVGTDWNSLSTGELITEPLKTCFYCSHTNMINHFPSLKIQKKLYRMVIHDRNISNKIVGEEIIYKDSK
jgi:hypothetical protein